MSNKRKLYIRLMRGAMLLCTALTAGLTLFLIGYVMIKGIPNITWELVSTKPSYLADRIYNRRGADKVAEVRGEIKSDLNDMNNWFLSWGGKIGMR